MENLKKSKNSWTDEKVEWVKRICLYAGISESVLETGKGSFYVVRDAESLINKYTMEAVDEYCKVHDFVDIQKMLCNILGVTMEQIIEIPLRIAIEKKSLDKSVYKFIANCE